MLSSNDTHSLQWRRSVVIYGGGVRVRFSLRPTSMISNHSTIPVLTACRCPEKLVLPSIFRHKSSCLMKWNLQSYQTAVLNERMWRFRGSKYALTVWPLLHIFSEVKTQTQGSTPLIAYIVELQLNCSRLEVCRSFRCTPKLFTSVNFYRFVQEQYGGPVWSTRFSNTTVIYKYSA